MGSTVSLASRFGLRSLASRLGLRPLACIVPRSSSSHWFSAVGNWGERIVLCTQELASRLGPRSLASWLLGLLMMEYVSNVRFLLMPNVDSMGSSGIGHVL
jgi:hypothetical protein